ncbi:MAG: ATP-dependent helicase [Chitinivibrionia bacterium]|nr:ATP-dependent helicase [Chitinivibrionia bacterium]
MTAIKLDERQKEAVLHTHGPLLILAGAGSGKTRVLTSRTERLIKEKIAKPEEILALTFTNKAAKEMKERISKAVGEDAAERMTVGTFHSLGVKILREYGKHLNLHENFTILSENDQISTIKTAVRDIGTKKLAEIPPEDLLREISNAKNAGIYPEDLKNDPEKKSVAKLYELYCKILNKRKSVDFDDLLLLPLKLFSQKEDVLQKFRSKYKFVSVDEFQDTNSVQLKLVRMIAEPHNNLMVVGDDDQGIYSWRGAEIKNILNFATVLHAKTVVLNRNYRSSQQIVDGANAMVCKNVRRKTKDIVSVIGKGEPICAYKAHDEDDEVKFVVDKVKEFTGANGAEHLTDISDMDDETKLAFKRIKEITAANLAGERQTSVKYENNEIALLFRTNLLMRRFEDGFRKAGIPYIIHGGKSFYDRREVKDIFSYLSFFANKFDELSLLRTVQVPNKGITASTISAIEEQAGQKKLSLWDSFEACAEGKEIAGAALRINVVQSENLKNYVKFMQKYAKKFSEGGQRLSKTLREMIDELKYVDMLKKTEEDEKKLEFRLESIEEIVKMLENYEAGKGNFATLGAFLQNISLAWGDKSSEFTKKSVVFMTMHKSKGLEFPVVFIPILEDGLVPSKKSLDEGKIEEERRLFYVSMTRAKERLFLSFSRFKQVRNRAVEIKPCRFLDEIPVECLDGKIGEKQDEEYKLILDEMFKKAQANFGE